MIAVRPEGSNFNGSSALSGRLPSHLLAVFRLPSWTVAGYAGTLILSLEFNRDFEHETSFGK
jgi:hypothetical protein